MCGYSGTRFCNAVPVLAIPVLLGGYSGTSSCNAGTNGSVLTCSEPEERHRRFPVAPAVSTHYCSLVAAYHVSVPDSIPYLSTAQLIPKVSDSKTPYLRPAHFIASMPQYRMKRRGRAYFSTGNLIAKA
eukprot:1513586-Rhodomonas_salina.1